MKNAKEDLIESLTELENFSIADLQNAIYPKYKKEFIQMINIYNSYRRVPEAYRTKGMIEYIEQFLKYNEQLSKN